MCAKGSHKVDGWNYQIPGCDESVHTFMTLSDAEDRMAILLLGILGKRESLRTAVSLWDVFCHG